MRILHVIPGLSVAQGGLQSALLNICRAQTAAGITPEIAALHEREPPDPAFGDFKTHLFECAFRPTGASPLMKSWLARHARDYGAVVAHSLWRDSLLYAAEADAPLVVVAHGMLDPEALRHRAWRKAWRLRMRLPAVLKRATVVYSCDGERERSSQGVHAARAEVIALPVAIPEPAASTPAGPIVTLGRIHSRKGLLEWVHALALLARQRAFMAVHAGPVEDAHYARRVYAAAKPLVEAGTLRFEGALPYARAQQLLAQASIVAAPCAVHENFGMVIAEGMALGKPVAAGRQGLIVPELAAAGAVIGTEIDPPELARAMASTLSDYDRALKVGAAGREWAIKNYSPQVVGRRWLELLATVS